jgi:hypothetical protein
MTSTRIAHRFDAEAGWFASRLFSWAGAVLCSSFPRRRESMDVDFNGALVIPSAAGDLLACKLPGKQIPPPAFTGLKANTLGMTGRKREHDLPRFRVRP